MIHDPTIRSATERCEHCGEVVGPLDRFCPSCGAVRGVTCPSCGALASGRSRRCAECGGPLPIPQPILAGETGDQRSSQKLSSRGRRLLVGGAVCLALIFAAVAWVYFTSPERQKEQPVSQVSTQTPDTLTIRSGGTPLALLGTSSGVLASEDQGTTWQQVLVNGGVKVIGVSPSGSGPIYLAGQRFWRGDGTGFQEVSTDLPLASVQALAVDAADPRRVYAVVAGRGLYGSDDSGQNWALLGGNVPANVTSLALVGADHPVFFVSTNGRGVFASADGRSWGNANGFVNGALPTQTVFALAFDPHSGDRYVGPSGQAQEGALYVGTDQGVFKSIDSGQSWSALPLRRPVGGIAVSASGERVMLAVDLNGNVYRSRDGGISWR